MYKSYHYNDMPKPVNTSKECISPKPASNCHNQGNNNFFSNIFGDLKNDDIILLVIIFVLLIDDCEDKLLLIALGFIFLSGLSE